MFGMLLAMVSRTSDVELVKRFKDGDRSAYNEIVRRYQNRVFSMCFRWMGDRSIAEEVAQDVFLALFRALDRFRGDAKLSTWIFRVTVNHCKNRSLYRQRRGKGRHVTIDGDMRDDDSPKRQIAAEGPGTDVSVHRSEAEELLHEGLAALDEDQRRIIILRDINDLSYDEIAKILKLPKGTVKSRLHRARGELARKLRGRISMSDVV